MPRQECEPVVYIWVNRVLDLPYFYDFRTAPTVWHFVLFFILRKFKNYLVMPLDISLSVLRRMAKHLNGEIIYDIMTVFCLISALCNVTFVLQIQLILVVKS